MLTWACSSPETTADPYPSRKYSDEFLMRFSSWHSRAFRHLCGCPVIAVATRIFTRKYNRHFQDRIFVPGFPSGAFFRTRSPIFPLVELMETHPHHRRLEKMPKLWNTDNVALNLDVLAKFDARRGKHAPRIDVVLQLHPVLPFKAHLVASCRRRWLKLTCLCRQRCNT